MQLACTLRGLKKKEFIWGVRLLSLKVRNFEGPILRKVARARYVEGLFLRKAVYFVKVSFENFLINGFSKYKTFDITSTCDFSEYRTFEVKDFRSKET